MRLLRVFLLIVRMRCLSATIFLPVRHLSCILTAPVSAHSFWDTCCYQILDTGSEVMYANIGSGSCEGFWYVFQTWKTYFIALLTFHILNISHTLWVEQRVCQSCSRQSLSQLRKHSLLATDNPSERVSSFLSAHQHIIGYFSALQWCEYRDKIVAI